MTFSTSCLNFTAELGGYRYRASIAELFMTVIQHDTVMRLFLPL